MTASSVNYMRIANGTAPILYVEDESNDVLLLKFALQAAGVTNRVVVAEDGERAIEYLAGEGSFSDRQQHPLPGVVILDLKMPRVTGFEVLEWARKRNDLRCLPFIVFSSSAHEGDVERCYALGANSFAVKPSGVDERNAFARGIKEYWLSFHQLGSAAPLR